MDTIKFSIGAKLITIITIIVLLSLGSIIVLVSWLVREDLRIAAELNNFEVNRHSATEAEFTLENIISNSMILMQTYNMVGKESALATETRDFFFGRNKNIAALVFQAANKEGVLLNSRYFVNQGLDQNLAGSYVQKQSGNLRRAAAGETLLLNASPHFGSFMLAMFFPLQTTGRQAQGAMVLFSPTNLSDTFGFGTNRSCLINDSGDVLVHADFELVKSASNLADAAFTKQIWSSQARNTQTLYTDENGIVYFGAFTKLDTAGCIVITSIEYDKVFEGLAATTRRNLYLTAAVLLISILFIWFFSKSISIPLRALALAARSIEGGIFEIDVTPKSRDEIGILTSSFQRMSKALGIFGRFTNRDIAVKAMRGEIKPGGLPRHATIFFSDIRGFTAKSEEFTKAFGKDASDRIVLWLNDYLTQMVECVEKAGGVVDKFIGDAVMAHWGTAYSAGSPQQDAVNCISSALMMRKALYSMNKYRKAGDKGNPPIQIGCGINTGIVTAGQIGSDLRMEYTVIGDPVNLASRIESLCKEFAADILVSEYTWNMIKNYFVTEEMPSVTVKGKEKPVRIFAVINIAGADKGPRNLAELRELLGIKAPDLSASAPDAEEKKYKIHKPAGRQN